MPSKSSESFAVHGASWLLLALALFVTARRLYFGVDFMDDSVCVAIPYRFALGGRPYVDEVNTIQSAGLLIEPFVRAWLAIAGGTDGLVLFLRWIWLGFTCGLAAVAVWSLRALVPMPVAVASAALLVAWMPGGSPVLSYNTLASMFFAAGLLFGVAPLVTGRSERWFLAAGACFGLCFVSIQTWGFAGLVAGILWLIASPYVTRRRRALYLFVGAVVSVLPFVPAFSNVGADALEFARGHSRGIFPLDEKFGGMATVLWRALSYPWLAVAAAVATVVLAWRGHRVAVLTLVLVFVQLVAAQRGHRSSLLQVTFLATIALLALPAATAGTKRLVRLLGIPAFVGALAASITSSNGSVNAGFALVALALVSFVVLFDLARACARPRIGAALVALTVATSTGWMLIHQRLPYNDDPIDTLDARFEAGPFRGLYTSTLKKEWFEQLTADVMEHARADRRVLAYYRMPAVYLISGMQPAANSVYTLKELGVVQWESLVPYQRALDAGDEREVVIVRMRRLVFGRERSQLTTFGSVDRWLERRAPRILERPDWDVFLARGR